MLACACYNIAELHSTISNFAALRCTCVCFLPHSLQNVFTAQSLQHRWYVIAGNHDHYGNVSAQVAYSKVSSRWYMPDLYYTEIISIPGTQDDVQFVFIDTIILAGLTHPVIRSIKPKGPSDFRAAQDQLAWIETTLSQSTAKWLFVLGHYPGVCVCVCVRACVRACVCMFWCTHEWAYECNQLPYCVPTI